MPRITYSERDSSLILFYSKFFPTPPGPACPLALIFQSTYMPPFGTWKGSKSSLLSMLEVTLASECRTDLEPESVTYLWSSRCLGTWSCLCGPGLHLLAVLGFSPTASASCSSRGPCCSGCAFLGPNATAIRMCLIAPLDYFSFSLIALF